MPDIIYPILDLFFLFFHTLLIIFNLFGWIFRKTRIANLITLLLTGLSWFGLGIFYGWGYCPLSDWHWQVLEKMGRYNIPVSYIQYIAERLLGADIGSTMADILTLTAFILALILSLFFNFRTRKP
jgi:hypothetical protein